MTSKKVFWKSVFFRNANKYVISKRKESKRNLGKNDLSTKTPERITLTKSNNPVVKPNKYTFFVPWIITKNKDENRFRALNG